MPVFKLKIMKGHLITLLLFCFSSAIAQDTIFLDQNYEEVLSEKAEFFRLDNRKGQNLIRKTFMMNGQILSEKEFLEKKGRLTAHGISKNWYDNGQLFYSQVYRKGERHGELLAYWEDGTPRRNDFFKKGKLISGKTWNRSGVEVPHFPVFVPPVFPGGKGAITAYLKQHIPVNPKQRKNTEIRVVVSFVVNKEGSIHQVEVLKEAPLWYKAVTVQTLLNMPQWEPAMHMGEPVNARYTLPVTFRK